jgi:hypothetical protein
MYKTYSAEYERAVKRRRKDMQDAMRDHVAARRIHDNFNAPGMRVHYQRVMGAMHRSVFDKVTDSKCKPWHKYKTGLWGCDGCSRKKRPSCHA